MNYPQTLRAVQRVEKDYWAIGDALVAEIGKAPKDQRNDGSVSLLLECAAELRAAGFGTWTAPRLAKLRQAATRFPHSATRNARLSFSVFEEVASATPDLTPAQRVKRLDSIIEAVEEEHPGKKVTVDRVRPHLGKRPTRYPAPAMPHKKGMSPVLRVADVLGLGVIAGDAAILGRKFIEAAAGFDLTDDEREELVYDIDKTIEAWKVARSAVKNPLAREVESFLREVS